MGMRISGLAIAISFLLPVAGICGLRLILRPTFPARAGVSTAPVALIPLPSTTTTPVPRPTCTSDWRIMPSPNGGSGGNVLNGMVSLAIDNVWAVGATSTGTTAQTLIEHWDGNVWSIVPSPNRGSGPNSLIGIAADTPNDIWAVGSAADVLILHYDGTGWNIVPTPSIGSGSSLSSVAALATNDVWAVGTTSSTGNDSLILHYDGTSWERIASPTGALGHVHLQDVGMAAAGDAWAVGYEVDTAGVYRYTVALHWNGTSWTRESTPNPGFEQQFLFGITSIHPDDAWAVGYYHDTGMNPLWSTLTIHWNGSTWQQVASPDAGDLNFLYGVRAAPPGDIWAVGAYKVDSNAHSVPLIEHWDGSAWSIVPSEAVAGTDSELHAVDICISNHPRTVGGQGTSSEGSVLIEEFTQSCVSPTPTAGATATMTPCATNFSDVRVGDYYYSSINCVYCMGAVSGYADGTFRPFNSTTRGQMAKIIVLALRLPLVTPTGTPTFRDVPATDPFYAYIETLWVGGVISGYSDGTFQPSSEVTRGQLSKIDAIAAAHVFGWTILDPLTPTFSDVQRDSPFYRYVETVACHGVVSGYADGRFLPANVAVRAQIAKIVCNTSQNPPGCLPDIPVPTATGMSKMP